MRFDLHTRATRKLASVVFVTLMLVYFLVSWTASRVQTDFGRVEVTNVHYANESNIPIRAKLFRPKEATAAQPLPGVVFMHGYQSTRETGDALNIELARRGFVVLAVDSIGRGNSGQPGRDTNAPGFDLSYGGKASLSYLKSKPFVRANSVGMLGHSLGAGVAYKMALADPSIQSLVIIGSAYDEKATYTTPKNMLMIIGQYDEFRDRMTGTRDIRSQWMKTAKTQSAIDASSPSLEVTYGNFANGTARRVVVPTVMHIEETHDSQVIEETLLWFQQSLRPPGRLWLDPQNQVWWIKEWSTLIAMLACFTSLLPLGLILMGTRFFETLQRRSGQRYLYVCTPLEYRRHALVNGLLMWLYLPAALIIFGIHRYVMAIDGLFPLMVANAIIGWFCLINAIGFLLFKRWLGRVGRDRSDLADYGLSWEKNRLTLNWNELAKAALLAAFLFLFAYGSESILESLYIVDFRFIFAFASDLTPYRWSLFALYFPLLLLGFLQLGFFLHVQLRLAQRKTWFQTYLHWTGRNLLALLLPLLLLLAVQYLPLFTTGAIPLVGPGGMFVLLMINVFHVVGVLLFVVPISTWCYTLTGRPYLGAFLCAAIVAWMFTSSQVIAPIPVK